MSSHDVIIIGGGLSGLAAGIRLSQFGKDVVVFERHHTPGGMNSFYYRHGREIDTGLHALTNISRSGVRTAPMNVLLRQLRLKREELDIREHRQSSVRFPGHVLTFDNDSRHLLEAVAEAFPGEADCFREFHRFLCDFNPFFADAAFHSSRKMLEERLGDPLLRDMIACPVMFYGNSREGDMDLRQFCIIYRSVFVEGMGRPAQGMGHVIQLLRRRLEENGGSLRLGCGIRSIRHDGRKVTGVVDDMGEEHCGSIYMSCAGGPETGRLLASPMPGLSDLVPGEVAYLEMLFELENLPESYGLHDGIEFHSRKMGFDYRCPEEGISEQGYIVCAPANFTGIASRELRVSALTSHRWWSRLDRDAYREAKSNIMKLAQDWLEMRFPGIRMKTQDMYTPRTIERFTGRIHGAIYGMPDKQWDGRTPLENLWLCGADQGYLGIVGALMSGVTMANLRLRES